MPLSVILVIFMSSLMTNAYADYYESGFRLIHNPTIYAMTPPPDPTIPNLDLQLFVQTQSAVLDWETHLNQGEGAHPLWNMNLVQIPYSQANYNSSTSSPADIQIFYLPSPTSTPSATEPVGITTYDFVNHRAQIIIYYDKITTRIITTETGYSSYVLFQYTPVSSYSDQLASDAQLGMAIEHELGHALGMGHYKISQDEENNIISGKQTDIPSIMIPVVIPVGVSGLGITQSDVIQLKSLYGNNGFDNPIQPMQNQETSMNNPKYDDVKNLLLTDIQYGSITDLHFESSFFALAQDGLIHINWQEKSIGHLIKPRWSNSIITFWAQDKISDEDYASCLQYLYDSKLLQT